MAFARRTGSLGAQAASRRDGSLVQFGGKRNVVFAPDGYSPESKDNTAPSFRLSREYVHGINGDASGGAIFVCNGCCIYAVAALCVVETVGKPFQSFFEGHTAEVLCLNYCADHDLAISGQRNARGQESGYACLWSPRSPGRTLAVLRYVLKVPESKVAHIGSAVGESIPAHVKPYTGEDIFSLRAITAVAIARHARTACMIGSDDKFTICIFAIPPNLENAKKGPISIPVAHSFTGGSVGIDRFYSHPGDDDASDKRFRFVGVGKNAFKFWDYRLEDNSCTCVYGKFGKTPQSYPTCFAYTKEDASTCLLCSQTGQMYVVSGTTCLFSVAVTKAKASLCVATLPPDASHSFVAASGDGEIMLGQLKGSRLQVVECFTLDKLAPQESERLPQGMRPRWKSVEVSMDGVALLFAQNHCLVAVDLGCLPGHQRRVLRIIQIGHGGEATALAHHPQMDGLCATCDNRGVVRFWDLSSKRSLAWKTFRVEQPVLTLAFSSIGDILAMGLSEGFVVVYEFPSMALIRRLRVSQHPSGKGQYEDMAELRFADQQSPKAPVILGCACMDQRVYLLKVFWGPHPKTPKGALNKEVVRQVSYQGALSGNSSSPIHIMFTADGRLLMSNSKDGQILVWKVSNGERITCLSALREADWQQWSCPLGWPTVGVWKQNFDPATMLTSVCQSCPNGAGGDRLQATADGEGRVSLFRFPAPIANTACHQYTGHSSRVASVRFSSSNVLATLGVRDHSLHQWRVVEGTLMDLENTSQSAERLWESAASGNTIERKGLRTQTGAPLPVASADFPAPADARRWVLDRIGVEFGKAPGVQTAKLGGYPDSNDPPRRSLDGLTAQGGNFDAAAADELDNRVIAANANVARAVLGWGEGRSHPSTCRPSSAPPARPSATDGAPLNSREVHGRLPSNGPTPSRPPRPPSALHTRGDSVSAGVARCRQLALSKGRM